MGTQSQRMRIIIAMISSYFLFAILLNSVGTVILQSIHTLGVSKTSAASLEGFKDLPIAIVSFLVASFIPRVGYKITLVVALVATTLACLMTPMINEFWVLKVLFATVGSAFALIKVSVYALVGQVTNNTKEHSSLFNIVEGMFMVGVLSGYWIFAYFIDPDALSSWTNVYYLLAALALLTLIVVLTAPIAPPERQNPEHSSPVNEFTNMLRLCAKPLVLVFVISAFFYVLIEQSIGSWLPTFNNEVLHLPVDISVQLTSLFAASLALGRLLAGVVLRFVNWYTLINVCVLCMAGLVLLTLPLTTGHSPAPIKSLFDAPLAAFLMPLIGLFMAPIYPMLNSTMLSSLPEHQHAPMTGLIVVFSALGGTTGSMITGAAFAKFGGTSAFYGVLIPISAILITLYFFKQLSKPATATDSGTL